MIAPLMITIYLGGVEVTQAVAVNRKTTIVAHTVADLVAQDTNVTNADMNNILAASAAVASPYAQGKRLAINGWWTGAGATGEPAWKGAERIGAAGTGIAVY